MHSPAFARSTADGDGTGGHGRVTLVAVRLVSDDRGVPVLHRRLVLLQHEEQSVGISVAEMLEAIRAVLRDTRIVDPPRVRNEGVDRGDVVRPDRRWSPSNPRARAPVRRLCRSAGHGDGHARQQPHDDAPMDEGGGIDTNTVRAHTSHPPDDERTAGDDDQHDRRDRGGFADGVFERAHPDMRPGHHSLVPARRTLEQSLKVGEHHHRRQHAERHRHDRCQALGHTLEPERLADRRPAGVDDHEDQCDGIRQQQRRPEKVSDALRPDHPSPSTSCMMAIGITIDSARAISR